MLLSLLLCVPLKWLSPTSGAGAEAVLDGNPATKWTPPGNPLNEGIMFVFEEALDLTAVSAGEGVTVYCGGAVQAAGRCTRTDKVFLKLTGAASLAEVTFEQSGKPLSVTPPRATQADITASSTLAPIDAFHPTFSVDGRLDFGWAVPNNGAGQSLVFTFAAAQAITALEIYNGYQRSDDHFKKNARVKTLVVNDVKVDLKDASGAQRVAVAVSSNKVTLKIAEVYPGSKYKDLVISELRFFDKDGAFVPVAKPREVPDQSKTVFGPIIDQPLKGCGDSYGTLKLRSNESFVAYVNTQDGPDDSVSKVIEGAWIPSAGGVFDIYARQYVVRSLDRPYGPAKVTKHTGVLGGKHTVKPATPEDVARFGCQGDVTITGPVFNGVYSR